MPEASPVGSESSSAQPAERSNAPETAATVDPRVLRTRSSIVETFNGLVLERPYDRVGVSEVASRAGVGRSTFYEHFRDKDELLRQSVTGMLRPLARAAGSDGGTAAGQADLVPRLVAILRHLVEERAVTRAMLDGPGRATIEEALAGLLEAELRPSTAGESSPTHAGTTTSGTPASGIPPAAARPSGRALAHQLACLQVGFLRGWLENEPPLPSRAGQAGGPSGRSGSRPGVAGAPAMIPVDTGRFEPVARRLIAVSQAFLGSASGGATGSGRPAPDAAY